MFTGIKYSNLWQYYAHNSSNEIIFKQAWTIVHFSICNTVTCINGKRTQGLAHSEIRIFFIWLEIVVTLVQQVKRNYYLFIHPSQDGPYYVIGYGGRVGVHTGFRTITLVLYIGSLPNLTTWLPCGRGRILFILAHLETGV
jgi:hypothetical protein